MLTCTVQLHAWEGCTNKTFSLILIKKGVSKKLLNTMFGMIRKINKLTGVVIIIVIKKNQILMMFEGDDRGDDISEVKNNFRAKTPYFFRICEYRNTSKVRNECTYKKRAWWGYKWVP